MWRCCHQLSPSLVSILCFTYQVKISFRFFVLIVNLLAVSSTFSSKPICCIECQFVFYVWVLLSTKSHFITQPLFRHLEEKKNIIFHQVWLSTQQENLASKFKERRSLRLINFAHFIARLSCADLNRKSVKIHQNFLIGKLCYVTSHQIIVGFLVVFIGFPCLPNIPSRVKC
jgi:hypothetical protein